MHLFISHATKDAAREALALVEALEARGHRCWIAPRDVKPGVPYPRQIVEAVERAQGLVLLVSPAASDSADVLQEVQLAASKKLTIAPVMLGAVNPGPDLRYYVSVRHQISWRGAEATAQALGATFGASAPPQSPQARTETPTPPASLPLWLIPAGLAALALVAVLFWQPWRAGETASNDRAPVEQSSGVSDSAARQSPASEQARADQSIPRPEMVRIPGRNFEVGRYEVTFAEWDACIAGGGCNGYRPDDHGWGRGRRPVINVSWNDAQAYVQWLSQRTGQRYRLLTEAEWEYAARAGTTTNFSWGDQDPVCDRGARNGAQPYNCTPQQTLPVGSFQPNGFGLYDVHGNVFEWVEDCYESSCSSRVVRGGSWVSPADDLRSALRDWNTATFRNVNIGFRVARTL